MIPNIFCWEGGVGLNGLQGKVHFHESLRISSYDSVLFARPTRRTRIAPKHDTKKKISSLLNDAWIAHLEQRACVKYTKYVNHVDRAHKTLVPEFYNLHFDL